MLKLVLIKWFPQKIMLLNQVCMQDPFKKVTCKKAVSSFFFYFSIFVSICVQYIVIAFTVVSGTYTGHILIIFVSPIPLFLFLCLLGCFLFCKNPVSQYLPLVFVFNLLEFFRWKKPWNIFKLVCLIYIPEYSLSRCIHFSHKWLIYSLWQSSTPLDINTIYSFFYICSLYFSFLMWEKPHGI